MSSGFEDRFQTLHEIVRAARRELAPGPWDYLVGGTETETPVTPPSGVSAFPLLDLDADRY